MSQTHLSKGFTIKADVVKDGYLYIEHQKPLTVEEMIELMDMTRERIKLIEKVPGLRLFMIVDLPELLLPSNGSDVVKKYGKELFHWPITIYLLTKNPKVDLYATILSQRTAEGFSINRNFATAKEAIESVQDQAQRVVAELAKLN
jgi:hypothetical protein